jgi:dihydroorotate dehydrogenase (NAD+) catalytic subunit
MLDREESILGYELNLSCPNVSYGTNGKHRMFAHDPELIREAVAAVRGTTQKTLIAKLSPEVSDIAAMALSAEKAGADAVSLVNTFTGMVIDVESRQTVLANRTGGLSGPCIRPIAVRMVHECFKALRIPVIGIGGIMNTRDALEFFIAGATCIQIGTANFVRPAASAEIIAGIETFMRDKGIQDIKDLVGSLDGGSR